MSRKPTPDELLSAMHSKCMDCCCGSRKAVQQCKSRDCSLWQYRETQMRERFRPIRGQITLFDLTRPQKETPETGAAGC